MSDRDDAMALHDRVGLVGLRAHATAVGLVQLTAELLRAGVLDDEAVGRIKEAIASDIMVANVNIRNRTGFEESLRRRLDKIFPSSEDVQERDQVGTSERMRSELGLEKGDDADRDDAS